MIFNLRKSKISINLGVVWKFISSQSIPGIHNTLIEMLEVQLDNSQENLPVRQLSRK